MSYPGVAAEYLIKTAAGHTWSEDDDYVVTNFLMFNSKEAVSPRYDPLYVWMEDEGYGVESRLLWWSAEFIGIAKFADAYTGRDIAGRTGRELSTQERVYMGIRATAETALFIYSAKSIGGAIRRRISPTKGLSNLQARQYYNSKMPVIKRAVTRWEGQGVPKSQIAQRAYSLRNTLKLRTRSLMANRAAATGLSKPFPYEYYYNKYYNQGYRGAALHDRIIKGALTPNPRVNKHFGIRR